MLTYKLHLMYDGTRFSGWQIQPHALSIQQIVQDAVRIVAKEEVNVIGSGRTDAGVHALDQVAHFRCQQELSLDKLFRSLNGLLPKDIRVTKAELATNTFHAQRSSINKEYHYRLCFGSYVSPFEKDYVWHIRFRLDVECLKEACQLFIGRHDFSSFANSAQTGACAKNPIRTLSKLDVKESENGLTLEFRADGFLYKMVRNIVGMLVEVASGKRACAEIPMLFTARDRTKAAQAAPPQGLFLVKVFYKEQ